MATRDELYQALRNADAAGDTEGARKLAAYIKTMPVETGAPASVKSDATMIGEQSPSAGVTAANGALFGFGDEIAGGIAATLKGIPGNDRGTEGTTWRQRYEGYRDLLRGKENAYREENPLKATGLQIAGSLPTMAVTGPAAAGVKGVGVAANALRAALTGGASGALTGAGNSTADNLSDVGIDALKGGALGAAAGGVTSPVAGMAGSIFKTGASKFSGSVADKYAREKLAQLFARGGVTVEQAANKLRALGPEASVAVSGRDAVLGQLDTLATLPGATKANTESAIAQLQAGRGARMRAAAYTALNAGGRRAASTVDDLIQQRSDAAKPLYDKLYKTGVFVDDELRGIIDAAAKLGATGEAKKVATAAQRDFTLTPETKWVGMRDLDYLKQGLDDIIGANKDTVTGRLTKVGAAVQGLKSQLTAQLDDATRGAYKEARDAFAGPTAIMDAVREGRRAMSQDDATISAAIKGLSDSELDGFRVGAFDALRAKLGAQSGQTELMKLWRSDANKEKLQALFGDEQTYLNFARAMHGERAMAKLETAGRGSQTASRQYAAGDLDTSAMAELGAAAGGSPLNMLGVASKVWNKVSTPERVRDAMGNILLSKGQKGVDELAALEQYVANLNLRRGTVASRAGAVAGSAANPLTQLIR